MSMENNLRALILPSQDVKAILPHAAVSEIITFRELDPLDSPFEGDWILGMTNWYGFRVPVVSLELLMDRPFKAPGQKAKIAICNVLDNDSQYPAVGLVVEAIPRLLLIDSDEQLLAGDATADFAVSALYKGEHVWIPDLEKIGQTINRELEQVSA